MSNSHASNYSKLSPQILSNTIRALSMDAVQQANSGHPGMPMGMADIAEVLWNNYLKHNPNNPNWINRDRFVLSNGHGSMLLYSLLHLTGYDLSIEDIKNFRQLSSKTPGHPEVQDTPGIETTTGPLGQGIANAVGFAMAEKQLAHQYNKTGFDLINHFTYVFMGDGCLMEGISHEVCSLAGTWELGKLIVFWDDNGISIDGEVDNWFSDNTPMRFKSYNWQVIENIDGHDAESINQAIQLAQSDLSKPTLICCKTQIGFGSPNKSGKSSSHGAPLGEEEIKLTKKNLNWPYKPFEIPAEISNQWNAQSKGKNLEAEWNDLFKAYKTQYPELAKKLVEQTAQTGCFKFNQNNPNWIESIQKGIESNKQLAQDYLKSGKKIATRKASQMALNHFSKIIPNFIGGSADLTGSNNTNWENCVPITKQNPYGNYIYYGVREFGMSAIMNGIALYGAHIPFGGTFMVFSDYARNAMRMSALMGQRVIYVMTHDSIGLGEDGPTHQPIEHVSSLRLIPNLNLWRPADCLESFIAWKESIENTSGPSVLSLSRQGLPEYSRSDEQINNISKGGYILSEPKEGAMINLVATGSEVELAMDTAKNLAQENIYARVCSMPCLEKFMEQSPEYQSSVLLDQLPTIIIEAGSGELWASLLPSVGAIVGMNRFGASAPIKDLNQKFGFTIDAIKNIVKEFI